MHKDLVEWLTKRAHDLVRLGRPLDPAVAGQLEAIAVEMLQTALELEKTDRL